MKTTHTLHRQAPASPLIASSDPSRLGEERRRDFVRLCRLISRRSKQPLTQRDIVNQALAHEAPGYYVDYTYALRVIGHVMTMPRTVAARYGRGKWLEIADRCRNEMEARRADSLNHALALVLSSGRASGFFLSASTALRILQQANATCRNNSFPNLNR